MSEELTPERLKVLRVRSCQNKRRYNNEEDARRAAKAYRKRWGSKMSVYECRLFCKGWHFGHDRKKFLQKKYEALSLLRFYLALLVIMSSTPEEADSDQETAPPVQDAPKTNSAPESWEDDLTLDSFSESVS